MACTTGCPTQDHESWGACLKSKDLRAAVSIPGNNWDRAQQSQWDRRIDAYKRARSEGIQPAGTSARQIEHAVKTSDALGTAYQAT